MNRIFPLAVFAAVFSSVYYACFVFAYTPVSYYPLLNEISSDVMPRTAGPAMGWFTWIVIGAISGLVAAMVAYLVPKRLGDKLGPALSWVVPLGVTLWILFVEKHWFLDAAVPGG
jgi:hypothetical protein